MASCWTPATAERPADCKHLREITIPATVVKIDNHAFDGGKGLTVYGTVGTEVERIAGRYGFTFVDLNEGTDRPVEPDIPEAPPIVLPFVLA